MWEGPALFIKGAKSKYINKRNIPVIEGFFPKARVETLDAGHWGESLTERVNCEGIPPFLTFDDACSAC